MPGLGKRTRSDEYVEVDKRASEVYHENTVVQENSSDQRGLNPRPSQNHKMAFRTRSMTPESSQENSDDEEEEDKEKAEDKESPTPPSPTRKDECLTSKKADALAVKPGAATCDECFDFPVATHQCIVCGAMCKVFQTPCSFCSFCLFVFLHWFNLF